MIEWLRWSLWATNRATVDAEQHDYSHKCEKDLSSPSVFTKNNWYWCCMFEGPLLWIWVAKVTHPERFLHEYKGHCLLKGLYLDLGAVVGVLCRQQTWEPLRLLLDRVLVLLLAGPVTVHVTRFRGEPSPPPVAAQAHIHCHILISSMDVWVGDAWGERRESLSNWETLRTLQQVTTGKLEGWTWLMTTQDCKTLIQYFHSIVKPQSLGTFNALCC